MKKYILDQDSKPVEEPDLLTWARWFENGNRIVGQDVVNDCEVSTVFLGIDHNFSSEGPPILWESMIFGGELGGYSARCSGTIEDAKIMHSQVIRYAIKNKPTYVQRLLRRLGLRRNKP